MTADVSFVIPVFNKAPYLRQCLESVLGQSFRSIEVICIDDASSDASGAILCDVARRDGRVRVLSNVRTLGAGRSRNRGLEAATGRFVRMIDADDLVPVNSTEALWERAMATGADLVRGTLQRFVNDDPAQVIFATNTPNRLETAFADETELWIPWWHTSYLISIDPLRDHAIRYPDLRRGEDPVFMAQVLVKSRRVSLIEDVVYRYRAYPKASGAAGETFADVVDSFHHAARVRKLFLEHHPTAWTSGYGPFLLSDFRKYLNRCRLSRDQAAFVNAEALEIWGEEPLVVAADAEVAEAGGVSETSSTDKLFWDSLFGRVDPFRYTSTYEQAKYGHTLELLPAQSATKALEIGCAEGLFTEDLAPRVERLLAIDISTKALARARQRVASADHVKFLEYDIADGVPGDDYNLIVCSEILYYLRDEAEVLAIGRRLRDCLAPNGYLLTTHSNAVSDDRDATGFDFHEIGAKFIGECFSSCSGLVFVRELRTDLYRVQLFRRVPIDGEGGSAAAPHEVLVRQHAGFNHASIKWGGCAVTASEARHFWRLAHVPILMYHRIADDGPAELAPYRLSPAKFERQLAWLARHGWHSLDLSTYCRLRFSEGRRDLPGKPIVLTFDDGYVDFYENAWPLLRKYGFSATVFSPVDLVGRSAEWDATFGEPAQLMSWEQMRELHGNGVAFGSHSCLHRRVTELTQEDLLADAVRSKQLLEERLGAPVSGYAYPYGVSDDRCRRVIAEAGYEWAVAVKGGNPPDRNDPHRIPRIEVFGDDDHEKFLSSLPDAEPTSEEIRQRYLDLKSRRDRATYMGR